MIASSYRQRGEWCFDFKNSVSVWSSWYSVFKVIRQLRSDTYRSHNLYSMIACIHLNLPPCWATPRYQVCKGWGHSQGLGSAGIDQCELPTLCSSHHRTQQLGRANDFKERGHKLLIVVVASLSSQCTSRTIQESSLTSRFSSPSRSVPLWNTLFRPIHSSSGLSKTSLLQVADQPSDGGW